MVLRNRFIISIVLSLIIGGLGLPQRPSEAVPNLELEMNDEIRPDHSFGGGYSGGSAPVASARAGSLTGSTLDHFRPGLPVRVALVSSGVDTSLFPSSLAANITTAGNLGDPLGYGSYAATVLFQLSETARVHSFGIYPDGALNPETLRLSLAFIINRINDYDVVLLAFPPTDYMDPVSSAMNSGLWDSILDSLHASPSYSSNGPLFGLPLDDEEFNDLHLSHYPWRYLQGFRTTLQYWKQITGHISTINSMGLAVVAPAGDLGPAPQSVLGLANLPNVVTVGAYNPADPTRSRPVGSISTSTAAGPSIDHKIKPDLIAPTGLMGLMPPSSTMAAHLSPVLDPSLVPEWSASGTSTSAARAIVDSSHTSAAVAAIAMGAIGNAGLRDPVKQKAALVARSSPLTGVPVWRQGAGLLGGTDLSLDILTRSQAESIPLFTSFPEFGLEPGSGTWSATATAVSATVDSATVSYRDFIGTNVVAKSVTTTATSSTSVPVTASISTSQVVLTAPVGNDTKEPGVYCGYLLATSTYTFSTTTVTEDLPWCLTNAIKPVARSFAIHDRSSDGQTFQLAPGLPPGASVVNHALHFLPVNPLSLTLFAVTTTTSSCIRYGSATTFAAAVPDTCHGLGNFASVPVGYYKVRAFSDYGSPITYDTHGTSGTTPGLTHSEEIGDRLGYSSFTTLLLGRAEGCKETYGPHDDWSGHSDEETYLYDWKTSEENSEDIETWKKCSEDKLDELLVADSVAQGQLDLTRKYESSIGGWAVSATVFSPSATASSPPVNIHMGSMRKAIQGAVTSRYIDIINPCSELRFASLRTPPLMPIGSITQAVTGTADWSKGCDNLESLTAQLSSSGDATGAIGLGVASYPFNIPSPNYSAHISLNFAYELQNAFIIVKVVTPGETMVGIVTPKGVIDLSSAGETSKLLLSSVDGTGTAANRATFDWRFLPRGASTGTIYFTFVPNQYSVTNGIQGLASWAKIKSNAWFNDTLSFALDTWSVAEWPGMNFENRYPVSMRTLSCSKTDLEDNDCGHAFQLDPAFSQWTADSSGKYSSGQIKAHLTPTNTVVVDECRAITGATQTAQVCEDWAMMAHLPRPYSDDLVTTTASLMDVLAISTSTVLPQTYSSVLQSLKDNGGRIYTPASARNHQAHSLLTFSGGVDAASTSTVGASMSTSGKYFE